ncbi:FecR family protein [Saccharicrinis sp. FJH62]|uniref:FecR family protein n=1 Tax=Saccharicrinis sp. FJH62 TaxID=3344657 RepID=UPI0035D47B16
MKNKKDNIRFKELLDKLNSGDTLLEELYELETIIEGKDTSDELSSQMLDELENEKYKRTEAFDKDKLFNRISDELSFASSRIEKRNEDKKVIWPKFMAFSRIAAVVFVSFILGGLTYYFINNQRVFQAGNSNCTEVAAPMGSISEIILPDGSHVWLNAGSNLRYSGTFNEKNRNVILEGEGYFQVAKNKKLPFIVNADGFLVEAVGTQFNVKAYEDEDAIETILVEGKVKLDHKSEKFAEDVYLNPNYKAIFYKNPEMNANGKTSRLVISQNVDPLPLISWKDNKLVFKGEPFRELVLKLGRKYDYTFRFESDDIKDLRFSGSFADESLLQVMDAIKLSCPITYAIQGKEVVIRKDISRLKKFN